MRDARRAAELAARNSYGRLIAILSSLSLDIARAEDALAEAFVAALNSWPEQGVPANCDAWLLTAARNKLKNEFRHQAMVAGSAVEIEMQYQALMNAQTPMLDERLKLLFVCAHPAIHEAARTPLMLQTVLGLDANRIAVAFLVPAATMSQRLVRAKSKIKEARLRFELPQGDDFHNRIEDVLNAVYAAYGTGWDDSAGELTSEAIFLGRLLVALLPTEPEVRGLLSLMLFCESRRDARRTAQGAFVPLNQQDTKLWSRDLIIEAEGLLITAARHGTFGRFQCEAAIQSVHAQRGITGSTNYDALKSLYSLLAQHTPSVGVHVARAGVYVEAGQPSAGLELLDKIDPLKIKTYQAFWVVKAKAHKILKQHQLSEQAMTTALSLTKDPAIKAFLGHSIN
jgi:RNA polymerase sigma-70 factor, ECF subfamily